MDKQAVLSVKDLCADYGKLQALRGVTFEVMGGAVGLLGPNGAGKSTLIKVLLNLMPPSSGSFRFMGEDSRLLGEGIRDRIGYVPEREGLRAGISGIGWVSFLGEMSGLPRRRAIERAHEMLNYVGLGESRYRDAQTYSTGMQQRLKFAVALVHDPAIVFLDEPTAGMDPAGREEVLELCRDLVRAGKTILFSTHILKDVEAICSTVVILNRGQVLASEPIENLKVAEERHFIVQWQGERENFLAACAGAGWEAKPGHESLVHLVLPPDAGARELFSLAAALDGSIHRLVREESSLEDAYLGMIARGN
ncbi:MAG: ABC transporter ATP-binding protein [bacterium]